MRNMLLRQCPSVGDSTERGSYACQVCHQAGGIRRRTFLRGLGTAGVLASVPRLLGVQNAHAQSGGTVRSDRFGRMFPNLPPFARDSRDLERALMDLGRPGGSGEIAKHPHAILGP